MPRSRDRHGRGLRGPLALPSPLTGRPVPIRSSPTKAQFFLSSVTDALTRIAAACPDAVEGIDFGIDEVPDASTMWAGMIEHDAVPLAAAIDADREHLARIVIYRRPLERRAHDRNDLRELVHETLVDQLSALTGRSVHELDPEADDD